MYSTLLKRFLNSSSDNLKSKIENLKWVGIVAIAVAFAMCGAGAQAQQPKKVPWIGFLSGASSSAVASRTGAFRQGLRELGYVEGKNIVIEWRYAQGKLDRLPTLAAKSQLPALYLNLEFVEDGGLMFYGVNLIDLYRRAATYVDKILKGAKPADIPIEQPKKFELVINLKAAKHIGLTIPPNVLARADRVIK